MIKNNTSEELKKNEILLNIELQSDNSIAVNENKSVVRRGFNEEDNKWFSHKEIVRLQQAQEELYWLLNRGYKMESTCQFIGNVYQFSQRQRNALQRGTSILSQCENRRASLLENSEIKNKELYIDGFNLIITLEVAMSQGILLLCNDGTIRDIAGLRGSYRIIDKTTKALELIGRSLEELKVSSVKIFLDAPVSNSGRLKSKILNLCESWTCNTEVELTPNPDLLLAKMERIITSDSVILDNCKSWFNLGRYIINNHIKGAKIIDLSGETTRK
ncbi:hypothetical protein SDC9_136062 [bioreactor metagenome]|uniref:DUF434 domain-containing protein n=2 Tax=root TaxID=1 RepID=A0ABS4JZS1_9CLOT|nr:MULTISPECIES: DUF434 domain-containing protein [Clostridium]EQB87049.1 hypothetical protein M918_11225 [Clostridium sp. BL8]MBP2021018.1 hypothetical protein [Clostridium punense]